MDKDLVNTALLATSFLILFGIAELLYHKAKIKVELTRKLVHIVTGLLTLLFPILLDNHWLVLLLCTSFAAILILSLRFNLLKSINAIERESVGSIAYPVAVYGSYLAFEYAGKDYLYFYLPILTLALCDPIAALTGKRWPIGRYKIGKDNKTLMGSTMFFLSAFGLAIAFNVSILHALVIGLMSAFIEAISPRGLDNITIPAIVLALLFNL